jgi:hypothetical protein
LTALSIVANLMSDFSGHKLHLNAICDNSGVISKCSKGLACSLRGNRAANLELYLNQRHRTSSTPTSFSWVRGHADNQQWQKITDLINQDLSRNEIYNVWCGRLAMQE